MSDRDITSKQHQSLVDAMKKQYEIDLARELELKKKRSLDLSNVVQPTSDTTTPTGVIGDTNKPPATAATTTTDNNGDSNSKPEDTDIPDWRESALSKRLKPIPGVDNTVWESRKQELGNIYKQAKEQKQYGELAETIGQALIQLGAGYSGLKTGTDMSGLKFNRANWEKQYDQLLDELRTGLQDTEHSRSAVERAHELATRDQDREQQRLDSAEESAKKRKFDMALQRIREKQDRTEQSERKQERSQDKQESLLAKQQEQAVKKQQERDQYIEQAKTELFNAADMSGNERNKAISKFKDNIVKAGGSAEQAQEWLDTNEHWYGDDYDAMISSINEWKQSLPSGVESQATTRDPYQDYADANFNGNLQAAKQFLRDKGALK